MFPTRFSFVFFTTYMLLIQAIIRSDCSEVVNESGKNNFNLNLSAAVNFVIKSVDARTVCVIGCNSYFLHNDFIEISDNWRTNVSLTLLNVETKYKSQRNFPKNDFILMLVDEEFAEYLPTFMANVMGRIRKHKMLVILKTKECENNGLLNELVSFLWSNKIFNFTILRHCNATTPEVYSYFPFANGSCREFRETNIVKLGTFYFNTSDNIYFHTEHVLNNNEMDTFTRNYLPFFPNKVPFKLNNCEVIVSTGIWKPCVVGVNSTENGIEMDFIFTAVRHMNASITVVVDPNIWNGLSQDESAEHTGTLALLKNETFDMMGGAMPAHCNIYRDFDTSEGYLPNSITFVVPTAAAFPSSEILRSMLEKQTKFLLFIVGAVLLSSIIINLLIQMAWKMRLNTEPKNSFLYSTMMTFLAFLRSLIETSTPSLPENRTIRWIYGMWFCVCVAVSCFFNTTLTSYFTEPGRLKQLETVQDIMDSNIQIALNDLYYPILTTDPDRQKHFISKNINCSVLHGLKFTAMGKAVTFTDILRSEYIAAQWVFSNGERPIQFIAEGSLRYWHNLVFHRGNVFADRINDLVKRINQSGYWEFQRRKYYHRRLIRIMVRQYLMVSNYILVISNDGLIKELNKDFLDSSDSFSKDMSHKSTLETNELEIIKRFVRTDKKLVTWEALSPVFRLWAIGMGTAGIVFLFEHVIHYLF